MYLFGQRIWVNIWIQTCLSLQSLDDKYSQISSNIKKGQIKNESQYEQCLIGVRFPNWIKLINLVRKLNSWLFDAKQHFRSN